MYCKLITFSISLLMAIAVTAQDSIYKPALQIINGEKEIEPLEFKINKTSVPRNISNKVIMRTPASNRLNNAKRPSDEVVPDDPGDNPGDPGPYEPPTPAPTIVAGRTASSLDVSSIGGSNFSVALAFPPGIADQLPHIALNYNSQSGMGLLGFGWSLSGLSAITRIAPTNYHDELLAPVNFNAGDRFALDGQRLVLKTGTYGADGAEYQTEQYSNTRIISHGISPYGTAYGPAYFEVIYGDGSKAFYGWNADSRTPNEFAISYTENAVGARINFSYLQVNNTACISQISYGALGSANPLNYINFSYTTSNRTEQRYVGGTALAQDRVINKISILASGQAYRHYLFTHNPVPTLNYPRVTMIQELNGSEDKALEPIYLSYGYTGDVISSHTISNLSLSGISSTNSQMVTADFTGNGTIDFLLYPNAKNKFWAFYDLEPGSPYMQLGYEINTGTFREIFAATELTYTNKILSGQGMALVKDNGYNNLKFTVYSSGTVAPVYFQYEREWNNIPPGQGYYSECDDQYHDGSPVNFDFISGDFNGDGMTDIVCVGKSNTVLLYEYIDNTNPGPGYPYPTINQIYPPAGNCVQQWGESGSPVYFVDLDRRLTSNYVFNLGQLYPYYTYGDKLQAADVNGDGKTDILLIKNGSMTAFTLNPNNYLEYLWQITDSRITNGQPSVLGDFNGDGKIDIMFSTGNNSLYATFISTGKGFIKQEQYQPFANIAGTWNGTPGIEQLQLHYIIGNDVNGDGKTDIISAQTTTRNNNSYGTIDVTVHHNIGNSASGAPIFSSGTGSSTYTNLRHYPMPIFLSPSGLNNNLEFGFMSDNSVSLFKFHKDQRKESQLTSVYQDGIYHTIEYQGLINGAGNDDVTMYQSDYEQTYPYINLFNLPGLQAVSKITRYHNGQQISQTFGYANGVSHAQGLGFLGFGEIVRSNWNTGWSDPNRSYDISISSPQLMGANIRNFQSKSSYINPSVKNFNLTNTAPAGPVNDGASAADYINRTDQVYTTQLLPNKVFVNKPVAVSLTDKLSGTYRIRTIEYDSYNNISKTTTNINGEGTHIVQTTYDNDPAAGFIGRLKSVSTTRSAAGQTLTWQETFDYTGSLLTTAKQKGHNTPENISTLQYDVYGNIVSKTLTVAGGGTRTESRVYDPSGRFVTQLTNADGKVTQSVFSQVTGDALSTTNHFGQTASIAYDDWGRKVQYTDYLGNNTYFNYQKSGSQTMLTETDDEGHYRLTLTDALGQKLEQQEKNVLGQVQGKGFQYDAYGRLTGESEPGQPGNYNQWNTNIYDEHGRISQAVTYTGKTTDYTYSGLNVTTNDGVRSVTIQKDALGNVASMQDPGGVISYTYFPDGHLQSASYNGFTQTIEQDGWGRKTKLTDPSAGIYQYEYDGFGQVTKETSPKGTTTYTYDNAGKLLQKKINGDLTNITSDYTYDPVTKLLMSMNVTNADGNNTTYTSTYDAYKRLAATVEDNPYATFGKNLTYDNFGRIATETYLATNKQNNASAQKTVELSYQYGDVVKMSLQGTNQVLWQINGLDAKGQLTTLLQGSNLKTSYAYSTASLPQQNIVENTAAASNTALMNLDYNFDAQRGVLNARNNNTLGWAESFSYDNLDRLVAFYDNSGNHTQSYDSRGRISNNSQIGDYSYESGNYKNSEIGNLTSTALSYYQNRHYQEIAYNAFKSPVDIFEDGRERISFQYNGSLTRSSMYYGDLNPDPFQRRFRRHYSEDGSAEITNDLSNGTTAITFYLGGDAYTAPALWKQVQGGGNNSGNLYFLHRDYLGSIALITNDLGQVIEHRQFDAWGNLVKLTDGNNNALAAFVVTDRGFTGHEHLTGIGLIHMNGRLYDPKLHRFLSPDNYVQDPFATQNFNRFGYATNNPLIYIDKNGEFIFALLAPVVGKLLAAVISGIVIGAAVSTATYTITGAINGNLSWGGVGKAALYGAVAGGISGGLSGLGGLLSSAATTTTTSFWQSSTFGMLKSFSSQIGADLVFGNKLTLGGVAGAVAGGFVGAKLPNWKASSGGYWSNAAGEIAHNTVKGGITGTAAGLVGAAVDGENLGKGALLGLRNGAMGGFAQSFAMVSFFGATYRQPVPAGFNAEGVLFRKGGLYQLVFNRAVTWGNNIIFKGDVPSSDVVHELTHYGQYLNQGWAIFQGRGIYEQFLNSVFGIEVYNYETYGTKYQESAASKVENDFLNRK